MKFQAKDIQICVWKFIRFSGRSCSSFAKKHPFVSCTLLFFFLLYIFLPSVFWFLAYALPIIVSTVVFVRVYLKLRCQNKENGKNDTFVSKNDRSCARVHSVRRRKSKEAYAKQSNIEDKSAISSSSFKNDLVNKNTLVEEENSKEIREVKVDSETVGAESCVDGDIEIPKKGFGTEGEITMASSEDTEDDDDDDEEEEEEEEESRDKGNKVVEWTEDDEKNLMDLGNSDIERNKRLESLIARRRARKLLSLQIRKTLMDMGNSNRHGDIGPIFVPKSNPFVPIDSNRHSSPTPGSAPSVLLPTYNPFDLPYDPFEEKPNLTGDSFDQEFIAPQEKDILFCRHESFSLGPLFTRESKPYRHEKQLGDAAITEVIERKLSQEVGANPLDSVVKEGQSSDVLDFDEREVQMTQVPVEDYNGGSSSSSSSVEEAPLSVANKDAILKSLASSSWKRMGKDNEDNALLYYHTYGSSSSALQKSRMETRHFYGDNQIRHTPSQSIASDMQVEVSEVNSPQNITSPDEGYPRYDGSIDKELNSYGEELWMPSSNLYAVEKAVEQDLIDFSSFLSSKTELPEGSRSELVTFNTENHDNGQSPTTSTSLPPENLTFLVPEQSLENLVARSSDDGDSRKPKESSYPPPEHSTSGVNAIHDLCDSIVLPSIEAINIDNQIVINRESSGDLKLSDGHIETPCDEPNGEYSNLDYSEIFPAEDGIVVEQVEMIEDLIVVEDSNIQELISETVSEQIETEVQLEVEQAPTVSLSSSPKSVLQPKFSMDQVSVSSLDQDMPVEAREYNREMVESSFSSEMPLTMNQNALNLTEDSTAHQSHDRDSEISQEMDEKAFRNDSIGDKDVNQAERELCSSSKNEQENNTMDIISKFVMDESKGKEKLASTEDYEENRLQKSIGDGAIAESSRPNMDEEESSSYKANQCR